MVEAPLRASSINPAQHGFPLKTLSFPNTYALTQTTHNAKNTPLKLGGELPLILNAERGNGEDEKGSWKNEQTSMREVVVGRKEEMAGV